MTAQKPSASSASAKPTSIGMTIHTGMLESLGINMYTSIGKSLVEFIANSFDADAKEVKITIPFDEIDVARKEVKATAKKEHAEGKRDSFKKVYETLPDNIAITIEDDGHGMTVTDLENKYLAVSRNRRDDSGPKSESGQRNVMGRKGLGKLAGFGTAGEVIVRSKRKGETHATTIVMNYDKIHQAEKLGEVKFDTVFEENLDPNISGTKITLKNLRCDSLRSGEDSIESIIARNFFLTGSDFQIYLNLKTIEPPAVDYEFIYPPENQRTEGGLAKIDVVVDENFSYPILAAVKFRGRVPKDDGKVRGHLAAYLRGARVYCNQRLAAGPTLFNLGTGMHNFHAQDYMECIVHADVLDQNETDLISTNRSALKTDNDVVDAFIRTITDLMKEAIKEHAKFREGQAEEEIKNDPESQAIIKMVEQLSPRNKEPAIRILKTIAAQEGINSTVYREVAPFFVKAVNSSEVFIDLIKSGVNPTSLQSIISQLAELSEVENSDVLKLYKARRHGILGLKKLEEKSYPANKGKKYEDEFHALLKTSPWLIKPEYSQYLTSDKPMGTVAQKLTTLLKIDDKAVDGLDDEDKRPDLVFVAANSPTPTNVTVIELKSPNIPLNSKHLDQLEKYMMQVEEIVKAGHKNIDVRVTGHLIGTMPALDTQALDAKHLRKKIMDSGANSPWEVITLQELLERAQKIHIDAIQALEAYEKKDGGGNDNTKPEDAKKAS